MAKLTILMATTDCKILQNSSFLQLPFDEHFSAVVCNQKINSSTNLHLNIPYVKVLNDSNKGISNNRNLGLSQVSEGWVHFCDDDVVFLPNYKNILLNAIAENANFDFLRFQVLQTPKKLLKNYPKNNFKIISNSIFNRKRILHFSSIEIVGKVRAIKDQKLLFNPLFGIGNSTYPTGEEVLFMLKAISKGLTIKYLPTPLLLHLETTSGKALNKPQLKVLGILFKKVFKQVSFIFIIYFALKKQALLQNQNISLRQAVQWMWNSKMKYEEE